MKNNIPTPFEINSNSLNLIKTKNHEFIPSLLPSFPFNDYVPEKPKNSQEADQDFLVPETPPTHNQNHQPTEQSNESKIGKQIVGDE